MPCILRFFLDIVYISNSFYILATTISLYRYFKKLFLFYPLDGHFDCFSFLAVMLYDLWLFVCEFLWEHAFISFDKYAEVNMVHACFDFTRNCQHDCMIFHSHQQFMSFSCSFQHVVSSVFLILTIMESVQWFYCDVYFLLRMIMLYVFLCALYIFFYLLL